MNNWLIRIGVVLFIAGAILAFGALAIGGNRGDESAIAYSCGYSDAQQDHIVKLRAVLREYNNSDLAPLPQCAHARILAAKAGFKRQQ